MNVPVRWAGEAVAVVASGPSVRQVDVNRLKGHARVIAVNDSWQLCPWADMLYAADRRWWEHHDYTPDFRGEKWTQQQGPKDWPTVAERRGLKVVTSAHKPGLSFDPTLVHTGMNSGFQALNLAVLQGASRILLLGFDLAVLDGNRHWFGNHPGRMNRDSPYSSFRKAFTEAAPQLEDFNIEVINCSMRSTLTCFPKQTVREALLTTREGHV